jgi:D-aminopeptidase
MTVTTTVTSNTMMAGKFRVPVGMTSADKHAAQAFLA